ncbi:MAG: TetR/AcrR family transcriptional regulator, partial [Mycobacterium sp.]
FREALVLPFTEFVDDFGRTWELVDHEEADEEKMARRFVGQLYDLFVEHQGLLLTLMAAEILSPEELAETGIADIRGALTVLSRIGAEGMRIRGMRTSRPDLPAHSTVAMIAGMAALRSTYFGSEQPSREAIVDELVQAILHGFLHRQD